MTTRFTRAQTPSVEFDHYSTYCTQWKRWVVGWLLFGTWISGARWRESVFRCYKSAIAIWTGGLVKRYRRVEEVHLALCASQTSMTTLEYTETAMVPGKTACIV
jgi:hypothetical protein